MPPLTIQLNGKQRSVDGVGEPASVDSLLAALELKPDRVAVEQNGEIVARSRWATTAVTSGDRIEIVHFVGGGSGDPCSAKAQE